jgi:hypothetical protein
MSRFSMMMNEIPQTETLRKRNSLPVGMDLCARPSCGGAYAPLKLQSVLPLETTPQDELQGLDHESRIAQEDILRGCASAQTACDAFLLVEEECWRQCQVQVQSLLLL